MKRRDFMVAMGIAGAALPLMSCAEKKPAESDEMVPGSDDETELLFVQNARRFSLVGGVLRLIDVGDSTLYFSDRPQHLVGHWKTDDFIG
ncbi:MAG: hypothetical protein V7722_05850, partial [Porticoccus sp.]